MHLTPSRTTTALWMIYQSNYSLLWIDRNIPLDIHCPGRRNHTSQQSGSRLWTQVVFTWVSETHKPDTLQNEADAALDFVRAEVKPISKPPAEKLCILKCRAVQEIHCSAIKYEWESISVLSRSCFAHIRFPSHSSTQASQPQGAAGSFLYWWDWGENWKGKILLENLWIEI